MLRLEWRCVRVPRGLRESVEFGEKIAAYA
jgi:hypothetical protein